MHFTGERMVPSVTGREELFFEHVVRYAFAARHVLGRRVLDAGCGCGYGAHFLRRAGASEVVGVDLDPAAIRYSRQHFDAEGHRFLTGDILDLPFADGSFDVVTCFEVFEHVDPPTALLAELRRVLKPDGIFVVSTPNALTYSADTVDGTNPFHVREYSPDELKKLLAEHFDDVDFFVQNPFGGIGIFPMDRPLDASAAVELRVLSPPEESLWGKPRDIHAAAEKCAYLIAECGATAASSEGRLYAMADDLSDTTLEKQAKEAYVEQLTEQYSLLKDEQAASSQWVRGVLEELSKAKSEIEHLSGEHSALEKEYASQKPWLHKLQKELRKSDHGRKKLEVYLEEVIANRDVERQAKEAAEARAVDLENQHADALTWAREIERQLDRTGKDHAALQASLNKASEWASELEKELEQTRAELERTRQAYGEIKAADEERSKWAQGMVGEIESSERVFQEMSAELEEKKAHEEKLSAWANSLETDLEAKEAAIARVEKEREATGKWARELAATLAEKEARQGELEKTFAELEANQKTTGAWAKEQAELLVASQSELEELRQAYAELKSHERSMSEWAREQAEQLAASQKALEEERRAYAELKSHERSMSEWAREQADQLAASQKAAEEWQTARTEQVRAEEERSSWAKGLEKELAQARAEIERLHAAHVDRERSEKETKLWAQDLEKALVDSQTELERIRGAYEELARTDEERSIWARDLEKRLIDREDGASSSEEISEQGTGAMMTPAL